MLEVLIALLTEVSPVPSLSAGVRSRNFPSAICLNVTPLPKVTAYCFGNWGFLILYADLLAYCSGTWGFLILYADLLA